jgi:hypothetical protein
LRERFTDYRRILYERGGIYAFRAPGDGRGQGLKSLDDGPHLSGPVPNETDVIAAAGGIADE